MAVAVSCCYKMCGLQDFRLPIRPLPACLLACCLCIVGEVVAEGLARSKRAGIERIIHIDTSQRMLDLAKVRRNVQYYLGGGVLQVDTFTAKRYSLHGIDWVSQRRTP
jgi:hypothetical protein